MPRVTLLSKPGCHLCDDARAALVGAGVAFEERDVTADDALWDEYGDRIPVVLLDDREHSYWTADVPRLLRDLAS
ncbi:MAG TPA: glutaredoxin family protein [Mycobacteriales bacterium]